MAEVHTTLRTPDVVVHNPGQHPLPPSAGIAVTVIAKPANSVQGGSAHGTASGVVFDNPA
jgi:hypothetical protein